MGSQGENGEVERQSEGQEERAVWAEGRQNVEEKGQSPGESRARQKERGSDGETLTVRKDQPGVGGTSVETPAEEVKRLGTKKGLGSQAGPPCMWRLSARSRAKSQRLLVWLCRKQQQWGMPVISALGR